MIEVFMPPYRPNRLCVKSKALQLLLGTPARCRWEVGSPHDSAQEGMDQGLVMQAEGPRCLNRYSDASTLCTPRSMPSQIICSSDIARRLPVEEGNVNLRMAVGQHWRRAEK